MCSRCICGARSGWIITYCAYGIRGVANQWFMSYLTEREQYVEFEGPNSKSVKNECGVPQGSILGPLLYLIYVNIYYSCQGNILSFADDTTTCPVQN